MEGSGIILQDNLILRSGEEPINVSFQILPINDKQGFWVNATSGIKVAVRYYDEASNTRRLSVVATVTEDTTVEGKIWIQLDNGIRKECNVTILPEIVPPPKFRNTPEIVFRGGKAIVEYEFLDIGENEDQTEINWYRVDKKDRSQFSIVNSSRRSNERDSRKLAITREDRPCKEIRLTSADIGKHIKVNIKPKHANSQKGLGLNVVSHIVKAADVDESVVILNPQTIVTNDDYDMEPGYFTVRGNIESGKCFSIPNRAALITESMGCGLYYMKEKAISDMSLVVLLDPECKTGDGFSGPCQYADIYIKYNPQTQNGYALRIENTPTDVGKVVFCLHHIKNGNSSPISDEYTSSAFKPGCEINLQVKDDILNAFITYDDGEDFSDVELRAKINPNDFGGFGFKFMAEPEVGYRCSMKYMEAIYEEGGYNIK